MNLSSWQWERLFKVYMAHVTREEGTDFLWNDYQIEDVAKEAEINPVEFSEFVAKEHAK